MKLCTRRTIVTLHSCDVIIWLLPTPQIKHSWVLIRSTILHYWFEYNIWITKNNLLLFIKTTSDDIMIAPLSCDWQPWHRIMIAPLSCDWQPAALVVPSVDRHLGRLVPDGQQNPVSSEDQGNHMYFFFSFFFQHNFNHKHISQYYKYHR